MSCGGQCPPYFSYYLSGKNPTARLFGIRIGYNVSASFGGVMERVD
jgi:hypothetical protein